MSDRYDENDSGQDMEDDPWEWVELIGCVAVGALAFFIIYVWAK